MLREPRTPSIFAEISAGDVIRRVCSGLFSCSLTCLVAWWLLPISGAYASCETQKSLYKDSVEICKKDKSYCVDVDLYRADVIAACGPGAVQTNASPAGDNEGQTGKSVGGKSANSGAKGNKNAASDPSDDPDDNPDSAFVEPNTPPSSCAFFTKPANEKFRLNYHTAGSFVCWRGNMYECWRDANGGKQWIRRAPCSSYQGAKEACKIEGTC
ncbi:hypothetical protein [Rhizobium sp. C4]|uniref:hypothetical protein n=1 Tax=Rhizobium sp. C4 TaxID=1349800 RepID=UPI001E418397|nr:hypothetical protein [Rhizobium sp. C4]MCD2176105.1 hypothetical protein [Rhizobium sp. C4]